MPVPTQISDGHRIASIDHLSNTLTVIDHEQHMIHEGNTYRVEVEETVGSGNDLSISFKTPTSKQLHMEYFFTTENTTTFSLYEESEISSGDSLTARNANRNYPDASETANLVKNASITTTNATTLVTHDYIVNSLDIGQFKWILKENKMYTFELSNESGADNNIFLRLDWYERERKTD